MHVVRIVYIYPLVCCVKSIYSLIYCAKSIYSFAFCAKSKYSPACRVGHPVFLHSACNVLLKNATFFFCVLFEFSATYETQKKIAIFCILFKRMRILSKERTFFSKERTFFSKERTFFKKKEHKCFFC